MDASHLRNAFAEQTVAVGTECRVVPYRLVDIHTDEPTIEQVVFNMLDQLTLRSDREQGLDQAGAQQSFWRNRRPTATQVKRLKMALMQCKIPSTKTRNLRNGCASGMRSSSDR